MAVSPTSADYLIVGAGSAGSALAFRLAQAGHEVIVIEHGGRGRNVLIDMPAALSYPMNMSLFDWGYFSEPEKHLNNRRMACPRGKAWGGSSAINGMVYVRGHRRDYDHWQESGAEGWSYRHVLPYFLRMETSHGGQTGWRGEDGPLHVTRAPHDNPLHPAFIAAGKEAGLGFTADYNGENPEGFCHFEQTVYRGIRWSAARAYLRPAAQLPNFRLLRGLVQKICFDGATATAVEVLRNGEPLRLTATREIILSASSINSPKILMLSGVGDAEALRALSIPVIADRKGVGKNLQDHLEAYIQQRCTRPVTLNRKLDLLSKALIGARWLFFRDGDGATNHFQSGAFLTSPNADYADIQFHFLPGAIRYDGKQASAGDGFQAHVGSMRSPSRGEVSLRDAKPDTPPVIQFNYMSHDEDWTRFRHCIHLAREVFAQPAMAEFCGTPIAPAGDQDADLDDYIRNAAESAYHPCGTCKMGSPDDPGAVVDPDCRVIGVERLRVVDSSIFPRITYGNLNAPSIMVGEKAADHILGKVLPPDSRPLN